ncbi:MAG: hypothetical protein WDO24_29940 [Pseudomonadota bacterium]
MTTGGLGTDGVKPGDTVQYTINFQISDFFGVDNLVLQDILGDGLSIDPTFAPTLSVTRDGVTQNIDFGAITSGTSPTVNGERSIPRARPPTGTISATTARRARPRRISMSARCSQRPAARRCCKAIRRHRRHLRHADLPSQSARQIHQHGERRLHPRDRPGARLGHGLGRSAEHRRHADRQYHLGHVAGDRRGAAGARPVW